MARKLLRTHADLADCATASVAYGHSVGKILAFAFVKLHVNVLGKEVEIIAAGEPRKGRILGEPAYDPKSERPRTDAVHQSA
ncbi:hypothetical protein KUW17_07500 [Leisingera aquaemixtae]|nr:hypothetical protein [Leisingera aquaemixtae]